MILSLDAMLGLVLSALTASILLQVSGNFDNSFSVKEIAGQRFCDSLALSLQGQKILLMQLRNGEKSEIQWQIEKIQGRYCVVVKSGEESIGNCSRGRNGQTVNRRVLFYDNGEFYEASVAVYFG